jgi:hypothetical protein
VYLQRCPLRLLHATACIACHAQGVHAAHLCSSFWCAEGMWAPSGASTGALPPPARPLQPGCCCCTLPMYLQHSSNSSTIGTIQHSKVACLIWWAGGGYVIILCTALAADTTQEVVRTDIRLCRCFLCIQARETTHLDTLIAAAHSGLHQHSASALSVNVASTKATIRTCCAMRATNIHLRTESLHHSHNKPSYVHTSSSASQPPSLVK